MDQTEQMSLFSPTEQKQSIPPDLQKQLLLMLEIGMGMEVIVAMLNAFYELDSCHLQYLGGAIVCGRTGWESTLPPWVLRAVYLSRLERVFEEMEQGEVGTLATPAEVVAVMHGYALQAPMHHDWADVYFWACAKTIPKYQARLMHYCEDRGIRTEKGMWKYLGSEPIPYSRIRWDYESLASDIRGRVIESGKTKGYGVKPKAEKQVKKTVEVESGSEQISLF